MILALVFVEPINGRNRLMFSLEFEPNNLSIRLIP